MDTSKWKLVKRAFSTAYDLDAAERPAFLHGLDDDVKAEVERLFAADSSAEDFIEQPAIYNPDNDQNSQPTEIDDYQIVSTLGTGGMGTVYLARHSGEGFSQNVALKLIKRGMDTDQVLRRFLIERQILADLDHPNIARMLDGGSTADGLPYFVMEYIDGTEIRKFCNLHDYDLDQRLDIFRKICSAVSSAHRNLVVHRDLKPSNILVTKDGEPKLLDFGIAKLLSPDWNTAADEATLTQFRVMTPEYASPEQIEGRSTSTSTDVYSLGVILYELVTGERPYDTRGHSQVELLQGLYLSEPPRPSTRNSGVTNNAGQETGEGRSGNTEIAPKKFSVDPKQLRGDLDNVILKALRREQDRRYQSVEEFAEDVRKFQTGLPVTATADSRSYRFKKFINRHRSGAIGFAAAVLLLLTATAVTGWQYSVANRERKLAEERFGQVRELARSLIFEYYDGIAKFNGTTELRQKMVTDGLKYLDGLSAEGVTDPELKREIAEGYAKIGDILGSPFTAANLGDTAGAVESYKKALAISQELYDADPGNADNLIGIRNSEMRVGEGLWALGQFSEAKEHLDKSLSYTKEADRLGVENDRAKAIDSYNRASQVRDQLNDLDGAMELQLVAYEMTKADLAADPNDLKKAMAVASTEIRLGDITYRKHDFKTSLDYMQKATIPVERTYESDKDNAKFKYNLSLMYARLGAVSGELGEHQNALEYNEKALRLIESVLEVDPKNALAKGNVATLDANYAEELCQVGKKSQCFEEYRRATKIYDELFSPENSSKYNYSKENYVANFNMFADKLLEDGKAADAKEIYSKALAMSKTLSAEGNNDQGFADSYRGIGYSYLAMGKNPENIAAAKENFELARGYYEKLIASNDIEPKTVPIYKKMIETLAGL